MAANFEEYAINKLETIEAELKTYIKLNEEKDRKLDELEEERRNLTLVIRRACELKESSSGEPYYSFDTVWKKYDPLEFQTISKFMKEEE